MNLVQEYLVLLNEVVSFRDTVSDSASAEIHNKKVNKMVALAAEIEHNAPELKKEFYDLLMNENADIRLWVAHHILELMTYERECRRVAIKEIRRRIRADKSALGYGEKVWLKNWYQSHPGDRWL